MMFSDFNSVFQDEQIFDGNVSSALQKAIDSDLPEGLTYSKVTDDFFAVTSTSGETNITFKVEIPEKAKKALKNVSDITSQTIAEYLYNSQTALNIIGDSNHCIDLNGNKIPIEKIGSYPFSNIEIKEARMFLMPPPMNEVIELKIGDGNIKKDLILLRQPNDSVYERKYVSDKTSCFQFTYYIDPEHIENIRFAFDISSENANSATDMLESYQLINAICDNRLHINEHHLVVNNTPNMKKIPLNIIKFWKRVVSLENHLNKRFTVNKGIKTIDARNVNSLYRSLIDNNPFRIDCDSVSLDGHDLSKDFVRGLIGNNENYIEFVEKKRIEVLGVDIEVIILSGIFNARLCEEESILDYDNNIFKLKLIGKEGKQLYESKIYFLPDDVEIDESKALKSHEHLLKDAEKIEEESIV
ncbi:Putative abortive phage resistance protein AbiGii toxin [Pseudobutyrivibrio sp. OR37]|nr:Putative abortive phage resistance protein AbiGii toxin [Pseudobutyrivibrio sp. OR37]